MRNRTGYSFHTAVGHLDDVVDRLVENGNTVATITDRDSTFGFRRFRDACKKKNMKPAYGVELGVVNEVAEKKPIINYFTFLAKNDIESINDLISIATDTNEKNPTFLVDIALRAKGVFKIVGERATFNQIQDCAGETDTYLALSPSTPKVLIKPAISQGLPLIATSDNYYTRKDDLDFYRTALGRRANTQTYAMHILSDEEWFATVKDMVSPEQAQDAINNRNNVLSQLNAQLLDAEMYKPVREKTLLEMCVEGAQRLRVNLEDPIYAARLERELHLIKEKDFEDYFYIIAEIVNWAKNEMIVGPARGSSCGSLVCYLLNITTVDPIKYNLIFERFIDINRKDMPDIDIDFSDKNRDKVFVEMKKRYGKDHVARLGTVGFFKQRTAIKQTATALKIPIAMTEKFIAATEDKLSIKQTFQTTEDGKKLLAAYPAAIIAEKLENHPNVSSQHAAGMLVTQEPIKKYVAVDSRSNAAMLDKKDAEVLNLLKIDALGLTQLSVFERTLKLIGEKPISGWLEQIPLDDPKAFEILNDEKFAGIFQFMGKALQGLCEKIVIDKLEDIVSITALARPGPMASGGAADWVKRRSGAESVTYTHDLMKELTKDTYGVLIYQEQVMQIVRQIGGLSWGDTSDIRRAIGKSMGAEALEKYYDMFKEGAVKNGVEEHIARKIWDDIVTFGRYGFNRSHAVAYGIVSYYCCWLKAYHPIEFCAATLDAETDATKQASLLRELKKEGIGYKPIDIEHSTDLWGVVEREGKKELVGPLTTINGLGPKFVNEILDARKTGSEIRAPLKKKLLNAKTSIDTLYPIRDAADKLCKNLTSDAEERFGKKFDDFTAVEDIKAGRAGNVYIIGVINKFTIRDDNDEASIAKRGYALKDENTKWLSMFMADDTGEIFCKITRFAYKGIAQPIINNGGLKKAVYMIEGTVPRNFRMIEINNFKFLGMRED